MHVPHLKPPIHTHFPCIQGSRPSQQVWVQIHVPVPVPMTEPMQNPQVYLYPQCSLATGMVKPVVFPKWEAQVQVQLPNLDTAHNHILIPWYHVYKQLFQPRVSSQ